MWLRNRFKGFLSFVERRTQRTSGSSGREGVNSHQGLRSMGSTDDTLAFVKAELGSGNPAQALCIANNLKKISMAIGAKKFLSDILEDILRQVKDTVRHGRAAAPQHVLAGRSAGGHRCTGTAVLLALWDPKWV